MFYTGAARYAALWAQRATLAVTLLYLTLAEPVFTRLCSIVGPVLPDVVVRLLLFPATCLLHLAMVAVALGSVALRGQQRVVASDTAKKAKDAGDGLSISVTAQWVCFARALAFTLHMRGGDSLASRLLHLLPAGSVGLLHGHIAKFRCRLSGRAYVPHWLRRELYADGPMVELVSDRTFFIDRCVGRVAGLARLVILGSGLDTRAYRLACLPKNCHVYEVDTPEMTTFKRDIVRKLALASVQPVHPVAVDFASQSFVEQLSQAGYTPAQSTGDSTHERTLFIIEGLINYLSEAKAEELLRTVASSYPGALVALTSRLAPPAYSAAELRRRRDVDAQLRGVGEPHQFTMPRDADVFLKRRGFVIVDRITRPLANLRSETAEKDHDYAVFLLKATAKAK